MTQSTDTVAMLHNARIALRFYRERMADSCPGVDYPHREVYGSITQTTFQEDVTMATYIICKYADNGCNQAHGIDEDEICGVRYFWELSGADGAWYLLFREPKHSDEDIRQAKEALRRSQDVTGIAVFRITEAALLDSARKAEVPE